MDSNEIILINKLIALGRETEWLEFKVDYVGHNERIGEYISSLSNSAAYYQKEEGYLIFGIDDKTAKIIGTNFDPNKTKGKGNTDLEIWLNANLEPKIDFTIKEIYHPDGKLVVFFIKATKSGPISFLGKRYIRIGSNQSSLEPYRDKEKVIWDRMSSFETVIAKDDVTENDVLDMLHYDGYFKMVGMSIPGTSHGIIEKFIEEKYLIQRNGKLCITNLGAILFAVDLSSFEKLSGKVVRIIRYDGNNKLNAIKDMFSRKGYAIDFDNFISHIQAQLFTKEIIKDGRRITTDNYPPETIREFIANALVHQDFSLPGGPLVEIFDDRIEISNPGKPLVKPERFIDTIPKSRNESLADSLRRLNICEKRGSGVDRALNAIEIAQLPAPYIYSSEVDVHAIIYARKDLNNLTTEEKMRACYWHCCVQYVVLNRYMTNTSLCSRLNISDKNKATASRIIKKAQEKNLIKPFDPDNRSLRYTKYVPYWT